MGCEAAWAFFGGVFKVLIPDNLKPVVTVADAVNPTFSAGWLDYAQARGFGPTRRGSDRRRTNHGWNGRCSTSGKTPSVASISSTSPQRVVGWCERTAGLRVHGTTAQRPAEHFTATEKGLLLPAPSQAYDVPIFATPKVARDLHIEVARGLYSVPGELLGQRVDVRADSSLVKVFSRGQLIKTHPRVRPGGRSTDPKDYPAGRAEYALRDVATLTAKAAAAGPAVGVYASRLLDVPLPWTSMRTVYRLLGLVRSYGPDKVNAACGWALELDVVDVDKIARMLEQAAERDPIPAAEAARVAGSPGRLARDPGEFQAGSR